MFYYMLICLCVSICTIPTSSFSVPKASHPLTTLSANQLGLIDEATRSISYTMRRSISAARSVPKKHLHTIEKRPQILGNNFLIKTTLQNNSYNQFVQSTPLIQSLQPHYKNQKIVFSTTPPIIAGSDAHSKKNGSLASSSGKVLENIGTQKSLSLKSDLGKTIWRIVTQNKEKHDPFPQNCHNSFMNTRWLDMYNKLVQRETPCDRVVDEPGENSPVVKFHQLMYEKIENKLGFPTIEEDATKTNQIPSPEHGNDIGTKNIKANDVVKTAFVKSHYFNIEGKTKIPTVFATFHSRNKTIHPWFVPIEQALMFSTLYQYRQEVALLKAWNPYSHMCIAAIPAGANVSIRVGLVAPQSFPAANAISTDLENTFKELKKEINYVKIIYPEDNDNLKKLHEALPGGATQLYFAYAYLGDIPKEFPGIKIHPLNDILYINNKPLEKKYLSSSDRDENKLNEKKIKIDSENSHVLCENYDKLQLCVHEGLFKKGIIDENERDDIKTIIQKLEKYKGF